MHIIARWPEVVDSLFKGDYTVLSGILIGFNAIQVNVFT